MSYDLRRLRLHGLIQRLPHTNTYILTPEGIRVAVFYTKLQNRLLRPLLDADKPPAPIEVRRALDHARTRHQRLHPQRPTRARRMKLVTTSRLSAPKSNQVELARRQQRRFVDLPGEATRPAAWQRRRGR